MSLRFSSWRPCHGYRYLVGVSSSPASLNSTFCPASPRRVHDQPPASSSTSSNPLVNPPASTRPPPLTSPQRSAFASRPRYLFELGKAYIRFYKDGVKALLTNRRLLQQVLARMPGDQRPSWLRVGYIPPSLSRADWVLFWRVRHDLLRLPLFGLMLLVIGEFTALVVIYVDGVVPYTCRFPRQVSNSLQRAEHRRQQAFHHLESRFPHGALSPNLTPKMAQAHVLRSLDLVGSMWDRLGFLPPVMWNIKGKLHMIFLMGDDMKLVRCGGVLGLVPEELRIACSERGINVLGKSDTELRRWLGDWLRLTASNDIEDRRRRMSMLMLTR